MQYVINPDTKIYVAISLVALISISGIMSTITSSNAILEKNKTNQQTEDDRGFGVDCDTECPSGEKKFNCDEFTGECKPIQKKFNCDEFTGECKPIPQIEL